ncbi:hypothetical protein P279_12680 [Rhodobacteraceae bacterium PD-2]|nr:hypothetical protein P279_12680 [Rhodobacteraceae bacterium PD-2]
MCDHLAEALHRNASGTYLQQRDAEVMRVLDENKALAMLITSRAVFLRSAGQEKVDARYFWVPLARSVRLKQGLAMPALPSSLGYASST